MKLGGSNLLKLITKQYKSAFTPTSLKLRRVKLALPAFTIVELLVVIVVIGILAAITVVSYSGITNRAVIANAQSDLSNASKKLKLYQLENDTYPIDKAAAINAKLIPNSDNYSYYVDNTTNPKTFCISYINLDNNIAYSINQDGSPIPAPYCPVLYLDASSPKSYPGSGTTWYDLSGYGNDGTVSNSEFMLLGDASYLRNIDNLSNFFSVAVPDSLSINNAFSAVTGGWTIEETVWTNSTIYPEADAGSVASNSASGTSSSVTGFDWNHGMQSNKFRFGLTSVGGNTYDDDIQFVVPTPYDTLNTWKTRTLIWDRSNNRVELYINGTYINQANTPNVAGQSIYDGGGIKFGELYGWKHYGRRSIIKIYNKILSVDEIVNDYQLISSRY